MIMLLKILIILFLPSKKSKLFVAVVILSAKDNQKVSKLLSKEFQRLVYWNEFETKSDT